MFVRTLALMMIILLPSITQADIFSGFGKDANNGEYATLAELSDYMAAQTIKHYDGYKLSRIKNQLFLTKDAIPDQNDAILPFSRQLADALEASLTTAGFRFAGILQGKDDIWLDVSYRVDKDKVLVTIRPSNLEGEHGTIRGTIHRAGFAAELFVEGVDERIGRLASKLASQCSITKKLKLLVQPVVSKNIGNSSLFAEHATNVLTAALSKHNNIELWQKDAPVAKKRSISGDMPLECGDVGYTGVDAVLLTTFYADANTININSTIRNQSCKIMAKDTAAIPGYMVTLPYSDDIVSKTALYADVEGQKNGEMLRISTTHGGLHQVYYAGEKYTLTAQLKTPLYLYLYDIYPDGKKVELIYPLEGETELLRQPGFYTIPEETEKGGAGIEVTNGDFGTDIIKVFASDKKLPLPGLDSNQKTRSFTTAGSRGGSRPKIQADLAGRAVINPADLVDYYRGIADKNGAKLYETSIYVETRPK